MTHNIESIRDAIAHLPGYSVESRGNGSTDIIAYSQNDIFSETFLRVMRDKGLTLIAIGPLGKRVGTLYEVKK